jgi:hypothetical protein
MAAVPDFTIPDNDNNNDFVNVVTQKLATLEGYIQQQDQAEGVKIEQINQMLAEIKRKIREMKAQIANLQGQAGNIGRNIKTNNTDIQINQQRIAELEAEKQRLADELAANKTRIAQLERDIEEAKRRGDNRMVGELAAQLADLKNKSRDDIERQRVALQQQIDTFIQDVARLTQENEALKTKYTNLMEAMKKAFQLLQTMNNRRPNSGDLQDFFVKIQSINRELDNAANDNGGANDNGLDNSGDEGSFFSNLFRRRPNPPPYPPPPRRRRLNELQPQPLQPGPVQPGPLPPQTPEEIFERQIADKSQEEQNIYRLVAQGKKTVDYNKVSKLINDNQVPIKRLYDTNQLNENTLRTFQGGRKTKKHRKRGKKTTTTKRRIKSRKQTKQTKQKGGYLIHKHRNKTPSKSKH